MGLLVRQINMVRSTILTSPSLAVVWGCKESAVKSTVVVIGRSIALQIVTNCQAEFRADVSCGTMSLMEWIIPWLIGQKLLVHLNLLIDADLSRGLNDRFVLNV